MQNCQTIGCSERATVRVRWVDSGYVVHAPKVDQHCARHGARKVANVASARIIGHVALSEG